jgi:hypothetical protein
MKQEKQNMKGLLVLLLLIVNVPSLHAQSQVVGRTVKAQGESISVHWQAGVSEKLLLDAANNLEIKYPEKIISASIDNHLKVINVVFKSALLTNEDLLQIIQMEGVMKPYFILQQRKYFLNTSGSIVFDFIK